MLGLTACGSSQKQHSSPTHKLTVTIGQQPIGSTRDCAHVAAATLGGVGERIYEESSHGANVGEALARVRASTALASAISAGDSAATRAALDGLLANQIARIEIVAHGKVLASAGSGAAIAPVRGSIPDITDRGFTFNQFLLTGEEPFLFHCGQRFLFDQVSTAIAKVIPMETLRWISFGHVEADECGAMNLLLDAAVNAEVVHGPLACALSLNDLCDRPPVAVASADAMPSRLENGWLRAALGRAQAGERPHEEQGDTPDGRGRRRPRPGTGADPGALKAARAQYFL